MQASSFALNRRGLLTALKEKQAETVVLHYVGHAYHTKGCPVWLPKALRDWKTEHSAARLIVMFHELYFALGKPWQTSFWLSSLSRKIMIDLTRISDHWVTSSIPAYDKVLSETGANTDRGTLIPVGSNIPVILASTFTKPWPLSSGAMLKVVLFGLPASRVAALRKHAELLQRLLDASMVESISLVGKSGNIQEEETLIASLGHREIWHREYDLSHEDISRVLTQQEIGLVATQPNLLTKSTVYAALCAHSIIPIVKDTPGANESTVPMLLVSDDNISSVVESLNNEQEMLSLKQSLRQTNENFLSWETIACKWASVVESVYAA